jgi:hypothetical protein
VRGKDVKSNLCYFICGGPCHTKECPNNEKFNVIMINDGDEKEVIIYVNPMFKSRDLVKEINLVKHNLARIDALRQGKLGSLNTLMYVKIRVGDKNVTSMLDLSDAYTFMANKLVSHTTMKVMNIML